MGKKLSSYEKAFKAARNAGVRYFYWTDPKDGIKRKYTTRLKEEDKDEKVYDDKDKYPDRRASYSTTKESEELDYNPQTTNPKEDITPQSVKRRGGMINRFKGGGIIQHD